jgi:transcriptional regulator with XRE-family HTH domain
MGTTNREDPSLRDVLRAIAKMTARRIETSSGVCASTIRNWRSGKTRSPQNKTLEFALRAAGFHRVIVRIGE